MDQLINESHENWYSPNIDETPVHVQCTYPTTKDLSWIDFFVNTFEYRETSELGVALTQGQVCPVICLLMSLLIFLFIQ